MNDLEKSWEQLPIRKVREAIDAQRKILRLVQEKNGGRTTYDTN